MAATSLHHCAASRNLYSTILANAHRCTFPFFRRPVDVHATINRAFIDAIAKERPRALAFSPLPFEGSHPIIEQKLRQVAERRWVFLMRLVLRDEVERKFGDAEAEAHHSRGRWSPFHFCRLHQRASDCTSVSAGAFQR